MSLDSISDIIADIKAGKPVILVDDEDRENEGDLIVAADYITPQLVNFMAVEARGLICLSMTSEQIQRLDLPLMTKEERNRAPLRTAFTVSIEAAKGVSTGISAADRALTIKVAANPMAKPDDVIVPGHVFPIRAQDGGVLKRAGHTEASVDLARLAGLNPAAVICEIMNPDGTMARMGQLVEFAKKHGVRIGTIESLIRYRIQNESFLVERAQSKLPTGFGGDYRIHVFENSLDGREHVAVVKGHLNPDEPVLVRVHSECLMGDVFRSTRTRSGEYLDLSFQRINDEGQGVVVYLRLEDMGHRLRQRVQSYQLVDQGTPATEDAKRAFRSDDRDYGIGAQILRALGIRKLRLITNNHAKRVGLKGYGLEIVEEIPLPLNTEPFADQED
ncbi:MAG TPA: 3,4-dihydroxy-2-butanone-4-phosphate synthase [Bdellovibrionales bacterium]|nr:3,4-dihydroxy-2-butanone-4-phosphate synthase [Bdellovibrionales bacterium]